MAKLLFRWALICSDCRALIKLKVSDKLPDSCPSCRAVFAEDQKHIEPDTTLGEK